MKYIKKFFKKDLPNKEYTVDDISRAIKNQNINELERISNKKNLNDVLGFGTTALNYAIYKGNHDVIDKLIELGANINLPAKGDNITPLIYAAQLDDYETIKKLLNSGADPYLTDNFGNSFIDHIEQDSILEYFKRDFPELYQEYLIKKDVRNYNL